MAAPLGTLFPRPRATTIGCDGLTDMLRILLFALTTAWSAATAAGTILVYGDSLSAAYGIGQKEGWVTLLEERLKQRKLDYSVANASISGETTSGGAARIDDALARFKPDVVIVALGGNDGLRGLPVPSQASPRPIV